MHWFLDWYLQEKSGQDFERGIFTRCYFQGKINQSPIT